MAGLGRGGWVMSTGRTSRGPKPTKFGNPETSEADDELRRDLRNRRAALMLVVSLLALGALGTISYFFA